MNMSPVSLRLEAEAFEFPLQDGTAVWCELQCPGMFEVSEYWLWPEAGEWLVQDAWKYSRVVKIVPFLWKPLLNAMLKAAYNTTAHSYIPMSYISRVCTSRTDNRRLCSTCHHIWKHSCRGCDSRTGLHREQHCIVTFTFFFFVLFLKKSLSSQIQIHKVTWMVWWMMCCTVGWQVPALVPVAGRRTVLELDITAAAAAPNGQGEKKKHNLMLWPL